MNENVLKFSVDFESLGKLGPNFLQSKEGQDALASGSLKGHDRLFISLSSSSILNTTLFIPGKKIIETGEQFDDAYLVLSGEIQIAQKEKSYKLGAGSVIGVPVTDEDQLLKTPSEFALTLNVYSVPPCSPLTTT